MLEHLPMALRPVMTFSYYTGWRVQSEVLTLRWSNVDLARGIVRLDGLVSKNGEGRTFPVAALPALAALLKQQRAETTAIERVTGTICPWVFHRDDGNPIRTYQSAWRKACALAATGGKTGKLAAIVRPNVVGRLVHDLRRTAVRNFVRAGVSEHTAMALTGHKTRAIFDRYDIVSESDLSAGVAKLAAHLNPKPAAGKRSRGTVEGQSPLRAVSGGTRA